MLFDPHPLCYPDIVSRPLKSESAATDNNIMKHHNHEADASPYTMFAATILLFVAFVAICSGCTSGSSSTPVESDPPPCYRADEPNDSFETPNVIVPEAPQFLVEGNIHAGDTDCTVATGLNGAPFNETGSPKRVEFSIDYAAGWQMDVYVGWQDPGGNGNHLWQRFDEGGQGGFSAVVEVPSGAGWLSLAIGHNTIHTPPDETRYTWSIETF